MFRKLLILCTLCLVLFACEKSTDPVYTVTAPTFTPSEGTYFSNVAVQLSCSIPNATIRYTLDGSEPNTNSAIYNTAIGIAGATTIKARAYKNKMKPSPVSSASYTFNVGAIYFSTMGGTFTQPKEVTLTTATENTEVHYTTDGTEPNESSQLYTSPILLDGNTVLKAKGYIAGWNPSVTHTHNFIFNTTKPTFTVVPGTYYNTFNVTLETITTGGNIRYTTDGSEPTETSTLYIDPITISTSKTITAKTFKSNWNTLDKSTAIYELKVIAPDITPNPGTYYTTQTANISCKTPDTKIYYTTNGVNPTTNSTVYSTPITITSTTSLRAIAVRSGWTTSNISSCSYNFAVIKPTLSPLPGTYSGQQTITIACETPDADIRYTTNGLEPTVSSTLYTDPFVILVNTTIKAKGYKNGFTPSLLATGSYTISNIVATPTFDPPAGVYYEPQNVVISCATSGATIRYTTNGSEPNTDSQEYTSPITVDANMVLKAKAYRLGYSTSLTASATYQFDTQNQIIAWGSNTYNQCNVPPGNDFSKIEAGMYHVVGLRTDGSLVAWGRNNYGQCNFPAGNDYIAVSAGDNHSIALKSNGTIVAWGRNDSLQCAIPPDSLGYVFSAISAGGNHSLGLLNNNTLVAWGANFFNQCEVPTGTFTKISAGANHNLAIRTNGTLVAWGNNDNGQINAPTGSNFVDIAAGDQHSVAKKNDNSLIAWGSNSSNQSSTPSGTSFNKIAAGYRHNLAIKTDGTLSTWGYSSGGLGTVPTTTTYIEVAAGRDFSVVLKNNPTSSNRRKFKNSKSNF